jgi:hypothetical protein
MHKHSLLRFYRQLLFHESNNSTLRASIRVAMRQIRAHGLDDVDTLLGLMRKQCRLTKTDRLRHKLLRHIRALRTMVTISSSSEDEKDSEQGKKTASSSSSTPSSSEDEEESTTKERYKVDRIKGFRLRGESNTRMYLVRWKGYGSNDDTWEPVDRLMEDQCGDLVACFHREHMRFF